MTDIRTDVLYRRTRYVYVVAQEEIESARWEFDLKSYIEQYVRNTIDRDMDAEFVSIEWRINAEHGWLHECHAIAWEPIAPVEGIDKVYIMPRRTLG